MRLLIIWINMHSSACKILNKIFLLKLWDWRNVMLAVTQVSELAKVLNCCNAREIYLRWRTSFNCFNKRNCIYQCLSSSSRQRVVVEVWHLSQENGLHMLLNARMLFTSRDFRFDGFGAKLCWTRCHAMLAFAKGFARRGLFPFVFNQSNSDCYPRWSRLWSPYKGII